jgi:hypothetical protein
MPKTHTVINAKKIQKFTINDRMPCCCHNYQINALILYKCNYLMLQIKPLQQKLELYNHGLLSCFIHFKQPHNNMHGYWVSFKKLIIKTNVFTLPRDIQSSKLVETTTIDARFGKTC